MTEFNTQICEAERSYRLQFETDNKEHFLVMQEMARKCVGDSNENGCQMYTEYRNGVPVAYRYGEPWVATQLFMEGGYKTPEEAKQAWLRECEK